MRKLIGPRLSIKAPTSVMFLDYVPTCSVFPKSGRYATASPNHVHGP